MVGWQQIFSRKFSPASKQVIIFILRNKKSSIQDCLIFFAVNLLMKKDHHLFHLVASVAERPCSSGMVSLTLYTRSSEDDLLGVIQAHLYLDVRTNTTVTPDEEQLTLRPTEKLALTIPRCAHNPETAFRILYYNKRHTRVSSKSQEHFVLMTKDRQRSGGNCCHNSLMNIREQ